MIVFLKGLQMSERFLIITKKIAIFLAISIWIALIIHIFKGGGGMQEQLPKCIFTTMITFGILTLIVTAIDKKLKRD